jgi:hypothetical protein
MTRRSRQFVAREIQRRQQEQSRPEGEVLQAQRLTAPPSPSAPVPCLRDAIEYKAAHPLGAFSRRRPYWEER